MHPPSKPTVKTVSFGRGDSEQYKETDLQRRDMATRTETSTDRGLGISLAFGALAALGAVAMAVGAPTLTAAWGFAAAVAFGTFAVAAIHVYWD